jgi:hypothetical protein
MVYDRTSSRTLQGRYAGTMLPRLTVQQCTRRCGCGRRLAWWTTTHAFCCRCMRSPDECPCPATTDPVEGCLGLNLAHVREPAGDDPDCE